MLGKLGPTAVTEILWPLPPAPLQEVEKKNCTETSRQARFLVK
ncbi:MAG: hypothetical protein WBA93_20785 [Microcoleaceae cyanobacterium]